jgi:hypothetical protein
MPDVKRVLDMERARKWFGRVLCALGVHDLEVIEVQIGFGPSGTVEKVQCRRCGYRGTRRGRA